MDEEQKEKLEKLFQGYLEMMDKENVSPFGQELVQKLHDTTCQFMLDKKEHLSGNILPEIFILGVAGIFLRTQIKFCMRAQKQYNPKSNVEEYTSYYEAIAYMFSEHFEVQEKIVNSRSETIQ